MNILALAVAALIPLLVGFVWYSDKVFGKAWQNAAGLKTEDLEGANMAVIFGGTLVLSFLLAVAVQFGVVHQMHIGSLLASDPDFADTSSELYQWYQGFMADHGSKHRTFGHGVFHGIFLAVMLALPVIAINALFERKGIKYVALHAGYWILTIALMGGVVSAWQ
ncbi:MAG: DUF1761 domain-containing protein [Phaeodactylibacter sp.]|nr:DUF1761 domain-containing protein [Phaeodactylibacter sp.]